MSFYNYLYLLVGKLVAAAGRLAVVAGRPAVVLDAAAAGRLAVVQASAVAGMWVAVAGRPAVGPKRPVDDTAAVEAGDTVWEAGLASWSAEVGAVEA